MKKSVLLPYQTLLIGALASVLGGGSASAAVIAWDTPATISADSEISTKGSLVYAYHFTRDPSAAAVVNAVSFETFQIPNQSSVTVGNVTVAGSVLDAGDSTDMLAIGPNGPAPSFAYQMDLVGWGVVDAFGDPFTLTLGGLTIGQDYELQIWSHGSGSSFLPQTNAKTVLSAAGSLSVTLDMNHTNSSSGLGQWVIGKFTATAATQAISIDGAVSGDRATINALQLRAIPEPSAALLLSGSSLAFSALRRRKPRLDGALS